jgi:hypothetical protein
MRSPIKVKARYRQEIIQRRFGEKAEVDERRIVLGFGNVSSAE